MELVSLVNKKIVRGNRNLRLAQKKGKQQYGKRPHNGLKNYLGKVVALSSDKPVGEETRLSEFVESITLNTLLAEVEASGITGMSGNGFPVAEKMKAFLASDAPKKVLLINAAECDPGLVHDSWLLKHRYPEIVLGIRYLQQAFSLQDTVLATKEATLEKTGGFGVMQVSPRFPSGQEHILIRQVFGIELDNDQPPAAHGILTMNLQTVYQIFKIINHAYDKGRFVTLADLTKGTARVAYIYPTDSIQSVLKNALGTQPKDALAYAGHGVIASALIEEATTFANGANFAAYALFPAISNQNSCKSCGACTRRCPAGIDIKKMVLALEKNPAASLSALQPENCIFCGVCTYYCRASKNVVAYIPMALGNQ